LTKQPGHLFGPFAWGAQLKMHVVPAGEVLTTVAVHE